MRFASFACFAGILSGLHRGQRPRLQVRRAPPHSSRCRVQVARCRWAVFDVPPFRVVRVFRGLFIRIEDDDEEEDDGADPIRGNWRSFVVVPPIHGLRFEGGLPRFCANFIREI